MSPTYTVASDQIRRTPPWLYRACCGLLEVEACDLDAFASRENALCRLYYDEMTDGLTRPWMAATFANPPFKLMGRVVAKALAEVECGHRTALIGPAGCSQAWFHRLWPRATVYLPTRRLVFLNRAGRPTRGAMQDSAVYIVHGIRHDVPQVRVLDVSFERGDDAADA